jgi:DNA-binding transcriptional LysR family regulator
MDLFASMSVFVAVADLGSFAAVAGQRGLSPPWSFDPAN